MNRSIYDVVLMSSGDIHKITQSVMDYADTSCIVLVWTTEYLTLAVQSIWLHPIVDEFIYNNAMYIILLLP